MICTSLSTDFGHRTDFARLIFLDSYYSFFVLYKSTSARVVIRQAPVPETRRHHTQGARRGHPCRMESFQVVV